jgi:hypothetical protein
VINGFRVNLFAIVVLLVASSAFGQLPAPTPALSANEILDKGVGQTRIYLETFKNLLSSETKTFEVYDKKGEIKKRRTITSSFIVYQLSKGGGRIAEYRNVLAVDGKTLDKTDERAQDFFERVEKAESSGQELGAIEKESLRYDDPIQINGLTLFQSLATAKNLRPLFEFTLEGKQIFNGAEVYVISYRQTQGSPDITLNSNEQRPGDRITLNMVVEVDGNPVLNERMRGKFLIDAATFRLWREEREITVQPAGFDVPLAAIREDFDYQNSDFEMLVPKKITHTHYRIKTKEKLAVKEVRVTFEYSKFTRPDVEVKGAEIK